MLRLKERNNELVIATQRKILDIQRTGVDEAAKLVGMVVSAA
jgi:hypothetical protein